MTPFKRILFAALTVASLSLSFVGISAAQDPRPGPESVPDRPGRRDGFLMDVITEITGLTRRQIRDGLRDGKTLAEIITENGGDVEAVRAALVAAIEEEIQTQLDNIETRVDDLLNSTMPGRRGAGRGSHLAERGIEALVLDSFLRQLRDADVNLRDLARSIEAGATVADILTTAGVDVEAFKTTAIIDVTAHLTRAVENGRLTQEEAEAFLADLPATVDSVLANPLPERPRGRRDGRGH
jgi:hypothetical protein